MGRRVVPLYYHGATSLLLRISFSQSDKEIKSNGFGTGINGKIACTKKIMADVPNLAVPFTAILRCCQ